jgi:NYN domain
VDRCALFVDAGYVLADGAMAVHGTRRRESVSWDYAGLLQLFGNLAMERTRLPLLRCYWYEATVEGRRSADHDVLADLPGVKLRLTKMRPGRREGVEGEIHRDLTTLARNKAVSDVMLVSAEEDLAQVIADVQDLGMRVTLLQITTDGNWSSSRALRQECDDIVDVSAEQLRPYVELISGAEPARPDESEAEPLALRPALNGSVIGVNGAGHAPARPAAASYGPLPGRPDAEQPSRRVALPAAPEPPAAEPERVDEPAAPEYAVADFGASVDYRASVDYGAPAEYAPAHERGHTAERPVADRVHADQGSAVEYGPAPDYAPAAAEYTPVPDYAAPAPPAAPPREDVYNSPREDVYAGPREDFYGAPPREEIYAAPVPEFSGYNPGGVREQVPVPSGLPVSGSAPVRRLPARGIGPAGPNSGQQPIGLPAAPGPMPSGPLHAAAPSVMPESGLGQQPGGPLPGGQPTGAQPVIPVAPVVPMDPNGMGYGPSRGAMGQPRQVPPGGTGGPVGLVNPNLPAGKPNPGIPALGPVNPGPSAPPMGPSNPGGQQDMGPQSGPIGIVGPNGYSGGGPGVSLGDAVQSAHEEGQAFGDSVARDAPALWLEAVLARKPRMPSDLEARLLQGSALPIDFLLHDEVRHALRRGFWDALERARR